MKTTKWVTALFVFAAGAMAACAATLNIGDPAPELQVSKWVQGDPVKAFEKDKAYIVEFWATWCGPCRVSIPHVNEIQNKYKDKGLIVIGQNVWEEDTSKVPGFIKTMGDKMTYRVALDTVGEGEKADKGKMSQTWMKASGSDGIPTAFLVDKQGKIAWIGHPMELEDTVIDQVLAGTYDVKKAAAEREKMQSSQDQLKKLSTQLRDQLENKEWEKAKATVAEFDKLVPESQRSGLDMVRVKLMLETGDPKGASKLAEQLADAHKDNERLQAVLALELVTADNNKTPDLELAQKLASRANDVSEGKNPNVLDILARVNFMQGNKDKAIELEKKAVELSEGKLKTHFEENLASYKEGKLPKAE